MEQKIVYFVVGPTAVGKTTFAIQLAKALKINGFDILVTANNHALDNGLYGVENTIETLREEGFIQTGTFKNNTYNTYWY